MKKTTKAKVEAWLANAQKLITEHYPEYSKELQELRRDMDYFCETLLPSFGFEIEKIYTPTPEEMERLKEIAREVARDFAKEERESNPNPYENDTKTVETYVTREDLTIAQGGYDPMQDQTRVWVECPVSYEIEDIGPYDIIHDSAIVQVERPLDMMPDDIDEYYDEY